MKRFWKILLLIVIAVLLAWSCSSTETIIKDKKIEITVPAIKDTLPAVYKNVPKPIADSLDKIFVALPDSARVEATKEIMIKNKSKIKNVKASIKYFPKRKVFELDIPEQKVDTTFSDTTKNVIKKETTTAEKFGYGTIGIIIFVIVGVFVFAAIKFKLFG